VVAEPVPAAQPLFALLADEQITDVLVNGQYGVWVDGQAGLKQVAVSLGPPEAIRALASQLAAWGGQRLDDASPAVDVTLPGQVRMHALLPPIAATGPLISLRIQRRQSFTVQELVQAGSIPTSCAELLRMLVTDRINFLISGATGAGKTTLLAALVNLMGPSERVVVIEEAAELVTDHPHCVRLETRSANAEGSGAFCLADLVRQSLRMRPDRIVLGECRGAEVREVLAALNTGHEGSCATVHANTAADVPARLAALGALAGMDHQTVAAQAVAALTAVLHVRRDRASRRRHLDQIAVLDLADGTLTSTPAVVIDGDDVRRGPGWDRLVARCGW
jgi:pilus assembly protein CpaF